MKALYFGLPLVFLSLLACNKNEVTSPDEPGTVVFPAGTTPVVNSILQKTTFNSAGKLSYTLYISGTNFRSDLKNNKVMFNNITADATVSDTEHFEVTVPEAAINTESKLTIITSGKYTVYGQPYKITQPETIVSSVNTEQLLRGGRVIVTGLGFSPAAAENVVTINGVKATVDSVGLKNQNLNFNAVLYNGITTNVQHDFPKAGFKLYVTVPQNAGAGKLTVTTFGKTVTYPYDMQILPSTFTSYSSTPINSISLDAAGNVYGVHNNKVLKVTPGGAVTTLATIGDATFILGDAVADAAGNVYVASGDDRSSEPGTMGPIYKTTASSAKIYKVTPDGTVSVFAGSDPGQADGQGTAAKFRYPTYMARNNKTGDLYVTDGTLIRKITPAGQVSTLAGKNHPLSPRAGAGAIDGQGAAADFYGLFGITVDQETGNLYVVDFNTTNGGLRQVTPTGYVSTPIITRAEPKGGRMPDIWFPGPTVAGIAVDADRNIVFAQDNQIVKIKNNVAYNTNLNPSGELISGLTLDASGKIWMAGGKQLYKITP